MQCEHCGGQFIPGENGNMVVDTCPNCGERPYRDQPSPLNSEMMLRNVPQPGELSEDSGGNPLDEGFAAQSDHDASSEGGWRNVMKRDESFASVKTSDLTNDYARELGIHPDEAQNELADYRDLGIGHPKICPTCGYEDFEHRPGEFGRNCPYGMENQYPHDEPSPGYELGGEAGSAAIEKAAGPLPGTSMPNQQGATCPTCGSPLRPNGTCPKCDPGDNTAAPAAGSGPGAMPTSMGTGVPGTFGSFEKSPHESACSSCSQETPANGHISRLGDVEEKVDGKFPLVHNSPAISKSPAKDHLYNWYNQRTRIYAPWDAPSGHFAGDLQVEQIQTIEPGPHTVEVTTNDESPLILQHDDPELLDAAKRQLEGSFRQAGPWQTGGNPDEWSGNSPAMQNYGIGAPGAPTTQPNPNVPMPGMNVKVPNPSGPLGGPADAPNALPGWAAPVLEGLLAYPALGAMGGALGDLGGGGAEGGAAVAAPGEVAPSAATGAPLEDAGSATSTGGGSSIKPNVNETGGLRSDLPNTKTPSWLDQHPTLKKALPWVGGGELGQAKGQGQDILKGLAGQAAKHVLHNALGLGGGGPDPMAPQMVPEPYLSHFMFAADDEDYDRPGSDDKLEERKGDDPHDVDPHEFEDGEDKGLYDRDDSDAGGAQNPRFDKSQDHHPDADQGAMDTGFSDDIWKQISSLLPLIMHHYQHGTGGSDPMLMDLHHKMEAEMPGYRDSAPDHAEMQMILMGPHGEMQKESEPEHEPKKSFHEELVATITPSQLNGPTPAGTGAMPAGPPATPVMQQQPFPSANCPYCGGNLQGQSCPQCGANVAGGQMNTAKVAGPMPGGPPPGAGGPPGGMPMMPPPPPPPGSAGAQGPHTQAQFAAVAALLQAEGREDEILTMLQNPQDYAEELSRAQRRETPPELEGSADQSPVPAQEEAPPGDTMPMPNPANQDQSQMLSRFTVSVDNITKTCPECGSHSTGMIGDDGEAMCRTCGHHFNQDTKNIEIQSSEQPNFEGKPADEQQLPPDPLGAQDPSHTWVDKDGAPLQVGQQYQMFSQQWDIPDIITITSVKPNGIKYEISGEYGFRHETEVTKEEADLDGINFVSVNNAPTLGEGFSPETNNDNAGAKELGQTDLASPHQNIAPGMSYAGIKEAIPGYSELIALRQECPAHVQRQLDDILIHQGLNSAIQFLKDQGITRPEPQDVATNAYEGLNQGPEMSWTASTGPAWLAREIGPEKIANTLIEQGRFDEAETLTKEAGRHYTQQEQNELIDEPGEARNLDKLALEGTHYLEESQDMALFF